MAAEILRSRQDLGENLDEILRSRRDLGENLGEFLARSWQSRRPKTRRDSQRDLAEISVKIWQGTLPRKGLFIDLSKDYKFAYVPR